MTLDVAVTAPQAFCPTCAQPCTHVHSLYQRPLADLPWATTPVQLHLRVRRFWCETPHCTRQTFTERLPQVARVLRGRLCGWRRCRPRPVWPSGALPEPGT